MLTASACTNAIVALQPPLHSQSQSQPNVAKWADQRLNPLAHPLAQVETQVQQRQEPKYPKRVIALLPYSAAKEGFNPDSDLSFAVGDEILVIDDAEGAVGWWRGSRKGFPDQVADFPSNFVRPK